VWLYRGNRNYPKYLVASFGIGLVFLSGRAFALPGFRQTTQGPEGVVTGTRFSGNVTATISKKVAFPDLKLKTLAGNKVQFQSGEGAPHLIAGMPQVLKTVRAFALPPGKTATAHLENVQWEESNERLALTKTPATLVWGKFQAFPSKANSGGFFPGKLVDTREANGQVFVTLFPAQVEIGTGRVMVMRSADLRVEYADGLREIVMPDIWSAPGLILTSEKMRSAAERLRKFHADVLKIRSEIVTVENIAETEAPIALEELPAGYKSNYPWENAVTPWDEVTKTGYDYELARKIIHFLQSKMGDQTATKYVTILGDATLVPPSYYFVIGSDEFVQMGVTDQCYAARKQCLEPRLAVGRLPFETEAQLETYLAKTERWLKDSQGAASELSLFGGKAFPAEIFTGELGTLKVINEARDDWRGVKKFFRTKKTYSKDSVLSALSGGAESSFLYYLDHGSGNVLHIDDEFISSLDIAKAKDSGRANPLMVSIACTDAAFDEKLSLERVLEYPKGGDVSIGTALLRSPAGAVAFLGSARPALGVPIYDVDTHGNLSLTDTTYGLQLFDTFFAKYRDERKGRLGDLLIKAYAAFLYEKGNDLEDENNLWTFYNVELLGDPALPLPDRGPGEFVQVPAASKLKMDLGSFGAFPVLQWVAGEMSFPLEAKGDVTASLLRIPGFDSGEDKEVQVDEQVVVSGSDYKVKFPEGTAAGKYLLRLENRRGVPFEKQVWFEVKDKNEKAREEVSPHP